MSLAELKDLLYSVPYNTSVRTQCPFCSGPNVFSITNSGSSIKYHCFRNSCKRSGSVDDVPTAEEVLRNLKERGATEEKKPFVLPTYLINGISHKNAHKWLSSTNGLDSYYRKMYKVGYDTIEDRVLYLLEDHKQIVGAVGRAVIRGTAPKVKLYPNSRIMPFIVGESSTGVVVEDCASATSINSIPSLTGIALLGTDFKTEYVPYMQRFTRLIVALDPDAKKKAIDLKTSLKYWCKDVEIWNIPTDFKNMEANEIREFLKEVA